MSTYLYLECIYNYSNKDVQIKLRLVIQNFFRILKVVLIWACK